MPSKVSPMYFDMEPRFNARRAERGSAGSSALQKAFLRNWPPVERGPADQPGKFSAEPSRADLPVWLRSGGWPLALLGIPMANVTIQQTLDLIGKMIDSRQSHYLATANLDFLVQAREDLELRRILLEAHAVLCDGTPLVWISRWLGNRLPERVAGSDVVPLLIRMAAEKKYRIFLLGGAAGSTARAVEKLRGQHPGLMIDHYAPPFNSLHQMDHDDIRRRIRSARPDLLLVAFGCPKQEKWISMHYRSLGVPVSVGVGATIDFIAGTAARAPRWMRRTGTEWVFRLLQEPRRLFRRYLHDLRCGLPAVAQQWWRLQFQRPARRTPRAAVSVRAEKFWRRIKLPPVWDIKALQRDAVLIENACLEWRNILLDLSGVRFIDSSAVAHLVRLQKQARFVNRKLILLAPSRAVVRALEAMRLRDYFSIARDNAGAQQLITAEETTSVVRQPGYFPTQPSLFWRGEITVANAEEVWRSTEPHILARTGGRERLLIDLSALQFIDSTGVGLMVRARKKAVEAGRQVIFTGVQPGVRNVLRLSRLESVLLAETA